MMPLQPARPWVQHWAHNSGGTHRGTVLRWVPAFYCVAKQAHGEMRTYDDNSSIDAWEKWMVVSIRKLHNSMR